VDETARQGVGAYGVVAEDGPGSDGCALNREEFRRLGFTLLDGGVGADQLDPLRKALGEVYGRQSADIGADALGGSVDADVARCLLAYDDRFLALATNPKLLSFCRGVFGESFLLLQQNGLINRPAKEHYQVRWHRDLPFQHWVSSETIALAALFCLDDFNITTGGTWALPGSHMHSDFPSDEFVRDHEQVMTAPAGTFIVMDAMMFHRAGRNTSDAVRTGINHLIGRPFLAQQIDIPRMLDREPPQDSVLSRYLGYRWAPAVSVEAWRNARVDRA
jgi:hypothetical protein